MWHRQTVKLVPPTLLLLVVWLLAGVGELYSQAPNAARTETVVTYMTEDGMTIFGTLHLPTGGTQPVPGIILFAEPGWIVRTTLEAPGRTLAEKYHMAALTVDHRGNGKSLNGKFFDQYAPDEVEKLQLDVRGAVKFLSAQKGVDPKRIGIVAVGVGADYALLEAGRDPNILALVVVSGSLEDRARNVIKSRPDVPIMFMAGPDDKEAFRENALGFSLSGNKNSKFVQMHSGHGTGMFSRTEGSLNWIQDWLNDNVKRVGVETEITLKTDDGWKLHGRLRVPDGFPNGTRFPAVAFSHGANHDQDTFHNLTEAMAKAGIATVTYDRRGRNMDLNEARPALPGGGIGDEALDVKAAVDFLVAQKSIDSSRIGLVGATAGNQPVFKEALVDMRIRTIVSFTLESIPDYVKKMMSTRDIPVFFIASTEDLNTGRKPPEYPYLADNSKEAYGLSKNRFSQFLLYDDAGRGSEMMKTKPELEGMVIRWFTDKLAAGSSDRSTVAEKQTK